jgi:hypothetical protein
MRKPTVLCGVVVGAGFGLLPFLWENKKLKLREWKPVHPQIVEGNQTLLRGNLRKLRPREQKSAYAIDVA